MANKVIATLALIIFVGCVVGSFLMGRATMSVGENKRDTVVLRELVRDIMPMPTSSSQIRTELALLPRSLPPINTSLPKVDTIKVVDSVLVEVPISRTEYSTDNYYIIAEGYRTKLLQVDVFPEQRIITEQVMKRKRWGVSIGVQGGYGITPKGYQPYAGVGVTFGYNF
jgi:hypothetical protein